MWNFKTANSNFYINQSFVAVFHIKSRGSGIANCCRSHARSIRVLAMTISGLSRPRYFGLGLDRCSIESRRGLARDHMIGLGLVWKTPFLIVKFCFLKTHER